MALLKGLLSFAGAFARDPLEAAVEAASKPRAGLAVGAYYSGALASAFWLRLVGGGEGGVVNVLDVSFLLFGAGLLGGLLYAGLANIFMEFTGAQGRSYSLFAAFGLAEGVKVLLIPLGLILSAFGAHGLALPLLLAVLAGQAWCAVALAKRLYGVGGLSALLALLFPAFAAAALAGFAAMSVAAWLFAALM